MLKVWGRKNSINVQKVMWCVGELGLKYERIDAGLQFGVINDASFRELNPNGLIPTIEDNGSTVWESHAIVRYLCATYGGGGLWPENPAVRSVADRWMDWLYTYFFIPHRVVFWGLIRTPEAERDMDAIKAQVEEGGNKLKVLDAQLEGNSFVAGESLSIGDFPIGCMTHRWFTMDIDRPSLPNIESWLARLRERTAFMEHVGLIPLT